jgi:hypothetical protein
MRRATAPVRPTEGGVDAVELTQEECRRLFHYDPETGVVTRLYTSSVQSRWKAGERVGAVTECGAYKQRRYRVLSIRVGGSHKRVYEHRFVWFYMLGRWPKQVDHINGDGCDNRWANLREASRTQNMQNKRIQRNNTSGIKGVSWYASKQKWRPEIKVNGRRISLGYYDNIRDAAAVYEEAARKYFGEFARVDRNR